MIIKCRSPTMRHVFRIHRVAQDWWFDRINLDLKIQIKYVESKNQLEDIFPKVSFTRDEWHNLLYLYSITNDTMSSCSHFSNGHFLQESNLNLSGIVEQISGAWLTNFKSIKHEDWRKAKTSETKANSSKLVLQGKGRNSVLFFSKICTRIHSYERSQEKARHLIYFSSRDTAYLWGKILRVTLEARGVRDTLKCELGKKVWTPNVVQFIEISRNRELRMVQKSLEVSQRRMLRETEKYESKNLSSQAMLIPDAKSDNGKGMEGGHKEGT